MRNAEKAGSTTRKPGNTVKERLNAIDDTRRDLASSDNEEDGDDEENDEEDTELDKVSEDDEPGWMMGAISTTVRQHMEIFGTSRWGFMNKHNRDVGTWLTTLMREILSLGRANCWFWQLSSLTETRLQPHHHRPHVESLCRLFISSRDNRKCRKGLLDQAILKWGWVQRNYIQQRHNVSPARHSTPFIPGFRIDASQTRKLQPLHIVSLAID